MFTVTAETTIHCNRCDQPFPSPKTMQRDGFCGTKVARISEFATCPHCQQTDAHWLYAADVMPTFEGNFESRKRQAQAWLLAN